MHLDVDTEAVRGVADALRDAASRASARRRPPRTDLPAL